jgi:hypothetical protein
MRTTIFLPMLLAALATVAPGGDIPVIRWSCNVASPSAYMLNLHRGESVILECQFLQGSTPLPLPGVYETLLRYRDDALPEGLYYAVTGNVYNAEAGIIRVPWHAADEPPADICQFTLAAKSASGTMLRANGTIRFRGTVDGVVTSQPPAVTTTFSWAAVEHLDIAAAPFIDDADLHALNQANADQDAAISNVVALVGDGVAVVTSNLNAHIAFAEGIDAAQDLLIEQALSSAIMGGDASGQSTNATVVSTRGRLFPTADDVPQDMEALVWNASLGRYVHGSVDLSGLEAGIQTLQETKAGRSEYAAWTNAITGMIDGNDHIPLGVVGFSSTNWIEVDPGTWEHVDHGTWRATAAVIANGQCELIQDHGMLIVDFTQCISRIHISATKDVAIDVAPDTSGPWTGYDPIRDNVPATNMFALRVWASGQASTITSLQVDTWQHPGRVGVSRDFSGIRLLVDTPDGSQDREAINVRYLHDFAPGGDLSGNLAGGLSISSIAGTPLNVSGKSTGYALLYYESIDQLRYADVATQGELTAALASKLDITNHTALAARMDAVESGAIPAGGDLDGTASSASVTGLRGISISVDAPEDGQVHMYDATSGIWTPRSLSTNANWSAGTNTVDDMPPAATGFFRAIVDGTPVMCMVADREIWGYGSSNGLVLPFGSLVLQNSNMTANVAAYDGNAVLPAYTFASDPDAGWFRSADNTWRYTAAGNQVAEFGVAGLTMLAGKEVILSDGLPAISLGDLGDYTRTSHTGDVSIAGNIQLSGPSSIIAAQDWESDLGSALQPFGRAYIATLHADEIDGVVSGNAGRGVLDGFALTNTCGLVMDSPSPLPPSIASDHLKLLITSTNAAWGPPVAAAGGFLLHNENPANGGYAGAVGINGRRIYTAGYMTNISLGANTQIGGSLDVSGDISASNINAMASMPDAPAIGIPHARLDGGWVRAWQVSTNNTPAAYTPDAVGQPLVIHGQTNVMYRAFGVSSNDWVQVWP